jgi:hypothetical protein
LSEEERRSTATEEAETARELVLALGLLDRDLGPVDDIEESSRGV